MKKLYKKELRKPSRIITQILSENIRTYRQLHNISQEKLADLCNVHRTYIGSIERGERNITLSTLEIIAEALNTSIPELLTKGSLKIDKK